MCFHSSVLAHIDTQGLVREDDWLTGSSTDIPEVIQKLLSKTSLSVSSEVQQALDKLSNGVALAEKQIERLFQARSDDFVAVLKAADSMRRKQAGSDVTFTVNLGTYQPLTTTL